MLKTFIFLCAIALILAASYWVSATQRIIKHKNNKFEKWKSQEALPVELESASLYSVEKKISIAEPVPLYGQADQVFLTKKNRLVVVDTKTRKSHQVYDSDIAQISVYATILRLTQEIKVASYGYIRTVVSHGSYDSICYNKVKLMSTQAVVARAKKQL